MENSVCMRLSPQHQLGTAEMPAKVVEAPALPKSSLFAPHATHHFKYVCLWGHGREENVCLVGKDLESCFLSRQGWEAVFSRAEVSLG